MTPEKKITAPPVIIPQFPPLIEPTTYSAYQQLFRTLVVMMVIVVVVDSIVVVVTNVSHMFKGLVKQFWNVCHRAVMVA